MNARVRRALGRTSYPFALLVILLLAWASLSAADEKKSAPAPKAAARAPAPMKSAAPARSAGAPGGAATRTLSHGPTTGSPGGLGGRPGGATTGSHPTTSNPRSLTANPGARGPNGMGTHPTGAATRPNAMEGHRTLGGTHAPGNVVRTRNGAEVRMRPGGRPGDVHLANRGMNIHHGLDGRRRVEVERADHSRIYAERGGHGYYSRRYDYHGREYAHRTYYYGGRPYDRFYNRYPYHGVYVDVYAPRYYYPPAFYAYAYYPWARPVVFAPAAWGWVGNPWYGYYGYYFSPYPAYAAPSFWLTDYLISTSLAAAYAAQAQANANAMAAAQAPPQGQVMLTPDVKNEIAEEVKQQLALENAEAQAHGQGTDPDPASSGVQRMLTDGKSHVFVAGHDLDLTDSGGAECSITEGDALQLSAPPPPDGTDASLVVLASKGGVECAKGATVTVAVADLQEMQNHMRETIAEGMQQMQAKQGQAGMPAIPPPAQAPPTQAFPADAPGPDPNAAAEISQQYQESDQAEKEALNQMPAAGPNDASIQNPSAGGAPAPQPATLSIGQTIDEVIASQGQPKSVVDLGAKKIYVYANLKITFKDGKVSDIQ